MTGETAAGSRERQGYILRRLAHILIAVLLQGGMLFTAAGSLDWPAAWILLGIYAGFLVINTTYLLHTGPALIAEHARIKPDAKRWDRPLATVISLWGPLLILLVAGLDFRHEWSVPGPASLAWTVAGVSILGYALWGWAMASNRFFAGVVRIQTERGHVVATRGPYRWVHHPGYTGLIAWTVAGPVLPGSWWALIPAGLTVATAIIRTILEDATLQAELNGYRAYAQQTRYRLLPGIW